MFHIDCPVTAELRQDHINYMSGGFDSAGAQTFGWIEKDGNLGDNTGPTSPEEVVYVGEILDPGVVVYLNPCYAWYDQTPTLIIFIH